MTRYWEIHEIYDILGQWDISLNWWKIHPLWIMLWKLLAKKKKCAKFRTDGRKLGNKHWLGSSSSSKSSIFSPRAWGVAFAILVLYELYGLFYLVQWHSLVSGGCFLCMNSTEGSKGELLTIFRVLSLCSCLLALCPMNTSCLEFPRQPSLVQELQ
jgi:hypothetical protein